MKTAIVNHYVETRSESLPKSLPQDAITFIERRLSLRGGTTLKEIGADLSNRFWISRHANAMGAAYAKLNSTEDLLADIDDVKALSVKQIATLRSEARETWAMEKASYELARVAATKHFSALARKYIETTYGELRTNADKLPIGFGNDITIERGHLKRASENGL